jgi:hypothetical protein
LRRAGGRFYFFMPYALKKAKQRQKTEATVAQIVFCAVRARAVYFFMPYALKKAKTNTKNGGDGRPNSIFVQEEYKI